MAVRAQAEVLWVSRRPNGPRRGADCWPGLPSEVMAASWAKQAPSVAGGGGWGGVNWRGHRDAGVDRKCP